MDTPNKRSGQNAISMLRAMRDRGMPAGYVVSDRGYFGHALAKNFNQPATALGYKVVGDYRIDQLGITSTQSGANFIEGDWYCPSMPSELVDASKTFREDHDLARYRARIAQRANYLFRNKDQSGNGVMRCPAQGPSPTAICPLRPTSGTTALGMPSVRQKAVILDVPEHQGACCSNAHSVTLRSETSDKLGQPVQYGSANHLAIYKPLRSIMEGFNGFTKDATNEGLDIAAHRRVRGWFANALVASLTLAVSNVRKIRAFLEAGQPPAMGPNPWLTPDEDAPDDAKQDPAEPGQWWLDDPPDAKPLRTAS